MNDKKANELVVNFAYAETKVHSYKYEEVDEDGKLIHPRECKVGAVYPKKSCFLGEAPAVLIATFRWV